MDRAKKPKFSSEDLTRWKKEINPAPIVSKRIKIQRVNDEWLGCCPDVFHKTALGKSDTHPSFTLYKLDDGTWAYKCFSCQACGNLFQFVQKFDGISFTEAVARVLEEAGIEGWQDGQEQEDVSMPASKPKKTVTFPMSQYAPAIEALEHAPDGQAWLRKRGIGMDVARKLKLGFVQSAAKIVPVHPWRDDGWVLFPTLSADGQTVTAVKYRSIVGKKEKRDNGELISGILRAPDTATTLYNLQAVKPGAEVWIVEGEPDVLALAQAGLVAVGLPMAGYKLSDEELEIVNNAPCRFLAGDGDAEGKKAMDKLAERLSGETHRIQWPNNRKDANDVLTHECGNDAAKFKVLVEDLKSRAAHKSGARTLTFTRGDQVKMRKVSWLWKGRLVADGLNSFSGEPGVGKSTVAADTIAAITRGRNFSDGAINELGPKDVLIICDEDGREDTIVPRLTLAGADMTHVWFQDVEIHQGQTLEQAGTRLDEDLPLIEEKLREHPGIVLIVPDPVTEYFGDANPNLDQEVGPIYSKMLQVSKRHHVAWLLISHFNKDRQATSTNRNSGAKVMVTKPRCNWLFAADPNSTDGRCLMLQGKCNLAKCRALAYYIETENVEINQDGELLVLESISHIRWDGETSDQADAVLLSMSDPKDRADTKVKAFLDDVLAEGPRRATECYDLGKQQGIFEDALKRHGRGISKAQVTSANGQNEWWWAKTKMELDDLRDRQREKNSVTDQKPSIDSVLAFLDGMIGQASMPVTILKSAAKARGLNWESVRTAHRRHGYESVATDQGKCWRKVPSTGPTESTLIAVEGEENVPF